MADPNTPVTTEDNTQGRLEPAVQKYVEQQNPAPSTTDTGMLAGMPPEGAKQQPLDVMREAFRSPEVSWLGQTEETPAVSPSQDEKYKFEENAIDKSRGFYMMRDDGSFPTEDDYYEYAIPDKDLAYKMRNIYRNGGAYIRAIDDQGNEMRDENGEYILQPLSWTKELERYTTPYDWDEGNVFEDIGQVRRVTKSVFAGPTGSGDLLEDNEKFKALGVTNPMARTMILRGIAQGRWSQEAALKDLQDLGVTAVSIPQYAGFAALNLTTHLGMTMMEAITTADLSAEKVELGKTFKKFSDAMEQGKQAVGIQDAISKRSGGIYDPTVIEETLKTRGVFQTLLQYAGPEVAVLGPWATLRTARASKNMLGFEKWIEKNYKTKNPLEALETALKNGTKPKEVIDNFTEETIKKSWFNWRRKKASNDIDFMLSRLMQDPSDARAVYLGQEVTSLRQKASLAQETLLSAVALGKKDVVKKQRAILENLDDQLYTTLYGKITPKYYKDIAGEGALTVGGTVAFLNVANQFMYDDPDNRIFYEIGGAFSTGLGKTGSQFAASEIYQNTTDALSDMSVAAWKFLRGEKNADNIDSGVRSRKAKKALKELMKQPTEFRDLALNGLSHMGEVRQRIINLNARTGKNIDENLALSNLATMMGIAQMMDVSRQLDDKLVATSLAEIAPTIMEKNVIENNKQVLISQMAQAAQELTDLKVAADLADDDPIAKMAKRMTRFASDQQARINEERKMLEGIAEQHRQSLEALMELDMASDVMTDNSVIVSFNQAMEAEYELAMDQLRGAVKNQVGPINEEFIQTSMQNLMDLRKKHFDMLSRINKGMSWQEAGSGKASLQFANLFSYNQRGYDATAAKMYSDFDIKNEGVFANVLDQFDEIMQVDVSDAERGVKALGKRQLLAGDQRAVGLLFNGAAERGLAKFESFYPDKAEFESVLEAADIPLDATPVEKWMAFRNTARTNPELLNLTPEEGLEVYSKMPLLVSAQEWRKVNSALGKVANASRDDGRRAAYNDVRSRWQTVGTDTLEDGSPNPYAFMRGWDTDEPPTMAGSEVYAELRQINDWYRVNVADRYYVDDVVVKMNNEVRTGVKGEAVKPGKETEEMLGSMQATMGATDAKNMPVFWLDNVMKKIEGQGAVLTGDKLYNSVGVYLAKIGGGVYDEKTGKYVLIDSSNLPAEFEAAEVTQQLKVILTRHLQGKAAMMLGDQVLPRDANGRVIFEQLEKQLKYDENMFKSLFNIPVYTRNEAGELVQATTKDGVPKTLLNELEVFDSISLDSLERTRLDLAKTFDQASKKVDNMMDEMDGKLNEYVWADPKGKKGRVARGANAIVKEEVIFTEKLLRNIYDIRPSSGAGGEVLYESAFDTSKKGKINELIFNSFVTDSNGKQNMERLRQIMIKDGENPDYVDDYIARAINDHISNVTSTNTGRTARVGADGATLEMDDYAVSATKIYEVIGTMGSDQRKRITELVGEDAVETWDLFAETIRRIDPPPSGSGIDTHLSSMSLDSILSRIYNINRGVVSVQWVATESILRAARNHHGVLLKTMLQDPKVAREILEIVESGKVPKYKTEPSWLRLLTANIVLAESRNEYAMEMINRYDPDVEYKDIDVAAEPQPEQPKPTPVLTEYDKELKEVGMRPLSQRPTQQGAIQ